MFTVPIYHVLLSAYISTRTERVLKSELYLTTRCAHIQMVVVRYRLKYVNAKGQI